MVAKHWLSPNNQQTAEQKGQPTAQEAFDLQLQGLLKQCKYRQALEEIHKIRQSIPEIEP